MLAIYKRELKSYFDSMIGYVFIAFMTAFTGIYFMVYNLNGGYPYFAYTLSAVVIFFLLGIPVLTMKSMAEERKSKTDQLLLTSPVSVGRIVTGKYLAMVTVFAVPVIITLFCPLIIKANGTAYLLEDYMSILAFFLLGCVFIAIGIFISSLTESLIISAVGTFGTLLFLYLWYGLSGYLPSAAGGSLFGLLLLFTLLCVLLYAMTRNWIIAVAAEAAGAAILIITYFVKPGIYENLLPDIFSKLAITNVFDNFTSYHIFDMGGLIYYLSIIIVFLFLTIQSVQKRRWS